MSTLIALVLKSLAILSHEIYFPSLTHHSPMELHAFINTYKYLCIYKCTHSCLYPQRTWQRFIKGPPFDKYNLTIHNIIEVMSVAVNWLGTLGLQTIWIDNVLEGKES